MPGQCQAACKRTAPDASHAPERCTSLWSRKAEPARPSQCLPAKSREVAEPSFFGAGAFFMPPEVPVRSLYTRRVAERVWSCTCALLVLGLAFVLGAAVLFTGWIYGLRH